VKYKIFIKILCAIYQKFYELIIVQPPFVHPLNFIYFSI
jgi:hypothetical protein